MANSIRARLFEFALATVTPRRPDNPDVVVAGADYIETAIANHYGSRGMQSFVFEQVPDQFGSR
jgi:hypothetical protein